MSTFFFFVSLISILASVRMCVGASSSILAGQSLFPNQTIISGGGGRFELGFFSPGNSSNYYVGIWYTNIPEQTVVWVANRNDPIPHSKYNNSRLQLLKNGTLQLVVLSQVIWDSGTSSVTEAKLVVSGHLELVDAEDIFEWTSRYQPTDTLLPLGVIGFRFYEGANTRLVSWKNPNDPAEGDYSLEMESTSDSQLFIKYKNSKKLWRGGVFLLGDSYRPITIGSNSSHSSGFQYGSAREFMIYQFSRLDKSVVTRIVMGYDGRLINYVWEEATRAWNVSWVVPSGACGRYASCGVNAICDASADPICSCLPGFVPQVEQAWKSHNFSNGCKRGKPLSCGHDRFRKLSGVRLPANAESSGIKTSGVCEHECRDNCSCFAYAFSKEVGCSIFKENLLDMERLSNSSAGSKIYIRIPGKSVLSLALGISFSAVFILLCCILFCYFWQKRKSKVPQPGSDFVHQNLLLLDLNSDGPENNTRPGDRANISGEDKNSKYELPTFSFSSIAAATNDFSMANKLGQGGFGPVYKGELLNGQFVAVKRLSKRSGQGLEEFKNESELIAKLQHRNLVGIVGCCIENEEKILVYEYLPNKSLDFFLFDPTKKELLDWGQRVHIIEGIAQGLLYLHQYSRLRIIHRDLKAGNILLDADMNPKISDFGLARIFGGTDLQANTNRIVGTYGYMSPEYAMEGIFSVKSDVYAFGVLLLEIISGKKNTGFYGSEHLSLLGYAWNLWTINRSIELIDPALEMHSSLSSIPLRYIQIGLLCVQNDLGDRPVMSDVVAMLSNEQKPLASPKHSALPLGRTLFEARPGQNEVEMCSVNDLTVSQIEAR